MAELKFEILYPCILPHDLLIVWKSFLEERDDVIECQSEILNWQWFVLKHEDSNHTEGSDRPVISMRRLTWKGRRMPSAQRAGCSARVVRDQLQGIIRDFISRVTSYLTASTSLLVVLCNSVGVTPPPSAGVEYPHRTLLMEEASSSISNGVFTSNRRSENSLP